MGVWTMKCIGYDNQLQTDLSEKFPVWDAMSTDDKKEYRKAIKLECDAKAKELGLRRKKTKETQAKTPATRKRKRKQTPNIETQNSDSGDETDDSDGLEYVDPPIDVHAREVIELTDDEEAEVPSKSSKGTRLSPICLW